jgi:hypothetical protein
LDEVVTALSNDKLDEYLDKKQEEIKVLADKVFIESGYVGNPELLKEDGSSGAAHKASVLNDTFDALLSFAYGAGENKMGFDKGIIDSYFGIEQGTGGVTGTIIDGLVALGNLFTGGSEPTAKAFGGSAFPGKSYLVGEMGPEMFTPNTVGTVSSNRTMTNTANQSGTDPELGATLTKAFSQLDTQSRVESQLIKMNRNLSRMLPKVMETDGIY